MVSALGAAVSHHEQGHVVGRVVGRDRDEGATELGARLSTRRACDCDVVPLPCPAGGVEEGCADREREGQQFATAAFCPFDPVPAHAPLSTRVPSAGSIVYSYHDHPIGSEPDDVADRDQARAAERDQPLRLLATDPRHQHRRMGADASAEEHEADPRLCLVSDRFRVVPAAYVALRRADQVLLQLRDQTGYMDGYWAAAAAGHVEADESVFEAAVREAQEELGIDIEAADLTPICAMHRTHGNHRSVDERVDFFFECRRWAGQPRLVESKALDLRWFDLHALPDNVVPHERRVFDALAAGDVRVITTFGF